eukprot:6149817-Prorocentrum_lima.AAC.1
MAANSGSGICRIAKEEGKSGSRERASSFKLQLRPRRPDIHSLRLEPLSSGRSMWTKRRRASSKG